jgi:hypothetical protein
MKEKILIFMLMLSIIAMMIWWASIVAGLVSNTLYMSPAFPEDEMYDGPNHG